MEPHIISIWGWNGYPHYLGRPFEQFCEENGITDLRQLKNGAFDPTHRLARLQRLAGLDISKVEFS